MPITISQIEEAEHKLVDLVWRLPQGRHRDDCTKALTQLRIAKTGLVAGTDTLRKRGRMGDQALKDAAHGCLAALTDGEACRAYKAGGRHSGTVNTALHDAHHALVRAGAICGGAETKETAGAFEAEDKKSAARARGLAKSSGMPVSVPVQPSRFVWEATGRIAALDAIERSVEQTRINRYRATQGLVPLQ
jgi:hypothetical protein